MKKKYLDILTKEFLEEEYLINKNFLRDICKRISCDRGTVRRYMSIHNIPLRTKSEEWKLIHLRHPKIGKGKNHFNYRKRGVETSGYKNGKTYNNKCIDCKTKISYRAIRCKECNKKILSALMSGNKHHFYGKKRPEHSKKVGGINNYNFGGTISETQKKAISIANSGEKNGSWRGGTSKLPYPFIFDNKLKEKIRKRDGYKCQNCNITEEEHIMVVGCVLSIHHIDYDKMNCEEDNLISLCNQCNTGANFNRNYWKKIYNFKMEIKNGNI